MHVETVTFETIEVGDAVHPFTIHSPLKTEVDGVAIPEDEMSATVERGEPRARPLSVGQDARGRRHYHHGLPRRDAASMGAGGDALRRRPPPLQGYKKLPARRHQHLPGHRHGQETAVNGKRLVDIEITGANQLGQLTGVTEATLVF